jgi:hypothetical protein
MLAAVPLRTLALAALLLATPAVAAPKHKGKSRGAPAAATATAPDAATAPRATASAARKLTFNGRALSPAQRAVIERLEASAGARLADGAYFYDPATGAAGAWGGPVGAFLPAGLDLNGRAPPEASGGGTGALTGVFVNGRELHPRDVEGLKELLGGVYRGRFWVDAKGNYGLEAAPAMGNLVAIARAHARAGKRGTSAWSRRYEGAGGTSIDLAGDG